MTIHILVINVISIARTTMLVCKRDKCQINYHIIVHILVTDMVNVNNLSILRNL
jgi:hypothetical protein